MFQLIKLSTNFFLQILSEKGVILHKNKMVLKKLKESFPPVSDKAFTGMIIFDKLEIPADVLTSDYIGVSIKNESVVTLFYRDIESGSIIFKDVSKGVDIKVMEESKGLRDLRKILKSKVGDHV